MSCFPRSMRMGWRPGPIPRPTVGLSIYLCRRRRLGAIWIRRVDGCSVRSRSSAEEDALMGQPTTEEVVRRYAEAIARGDLDAQEALRHPGWSADWPQSGERVTNAGDYRSINEAYPGGSPRSAM